MTHAPFPFSLVLFALCGGYLSGSVPYGLLLGKLCGAGDLRQKGSGNIGATNALRVGGKKLGIATLLLDALKGAVPVLVAKAAHPDLALIAGFGAFTGHLFPVWLKFKGGKGVAVALGVLLALQWQVGVALCLVWLATAIWSKYSSLSALVAFGVSPLLSYLVTHNPSVVLFTLVLAVMIWLKHAGNIKRLAQGTEGKINLRKASAHDAQKP
ncbi:MAG: glycerol-3-phosphate 1-O-acyltransferase PlsY [Alphaproteobacteria bacterium]|nr:glycerol-3-phosphate 1-O-acyltransferase PlsY [Alphaproteobacteria bacterium]